MRFYSTHGDRKKHGQGNTDEKEREVKLSKSADGTMETKQRICRQGNHQGNGKQTRKTNLGQCSQCEVDWANQTGSHVDMQ